MGDSTPDLEAIASRFELPAAVTSVTPLGNGNVNDTYRVETASGDRFVLQRLNTLVFPEPELVMRNLQVLSAHALRRPVPAQRWEVPRVINQRHTNQPWVRADGQFWRLISFIDDAVTLEAITHPQQAREVGRGLGLFHQLLSDLPADQLADTLPGFHITPTYLASYEQALQSTQLELCGQGSWCAAFVEQRRNLAKVLETAKAEGRLGLRPIHGDPKVNNVMLCASSGTAVSLVDLDTVKPGLVHYDIGDCLRSCCNRLGEETTALDAVRFDLDLAQAILEGYLAEAGGLLTPLELQLIPDAARLISFELGLRFFTDHLNGNVYFKAQHPEHNLQRALVQFRLTASIEAQMEPLRRLVQRLTPAQAQAPRGSAA